MAWTGFLTRPQLPALVRALNLDRLYIPLLNAMKLPIQIYKRLGKADTQALIDSGATSNFIDHKEVVRLRLGTKKLQKEIKVYNVDESHNKGGTISETVHLIVQQGNHTKRMMFYVTNLGKNRMILGYPWLREFNPNIDWKEGKILGSQVRIHTLQKATGLDGFQKKLRALAVTLEEGEELHYQINKVTTATEMAIASYDPTKVNSIDTIPTRYHRYLKVFSDEEAQRFPPSQPWDHHIRLKPEAPSTINGKLKSLSIAEREAERKYLDENIEKGYIEECNGPYGHMLFFVKKKNGELRPVVDYRPLNKATIPDVTPMPIIRDIHDKMKGKRLFSKFDIRWGYNNIQIVPEDRWKTGFKTTRGLFQSNVMNFRLTNTPPTFCCMGLHVFKPLTDKFPEDCDYYMDDFGIMTDNSPEEIEKHREITKQFLQICEKFSLFLKPE